MLYMYMYLAVNFIEMINRCQKFEVRRQKYKYVRETEFLDSHSLLPIKHKYEIHVLHNYQFSKDQSSVKLF